ncbi:MAG: SrfA family protein [Rhodospirillales bacterium]
MAGALLRSGSLTEFHPLGAVGKPVYSAASQLRAAVRRLYGSETADLFAIPKRHDQGDVIDWYAPEPGPVVPWSAATEDERTEAVALIHAARDRLAAQSQALQGDAETSERKVFGRLLAQATRIPGEDHIYLVNGRPVMTFWGFHPLNAAPGFDIIGGLLPAAAAPAPVPPTEVAPALTEEAPRVEAIPPARPWYRRWWLWLPLLLLLLLLLLVGLKSCGVPVPYTGWVPALQESATQVPPDLKPLLGPDGRPITSSEGSPIYVDHAGRTVTVDAQGNLVAVGPDGKPLEGAGPLPPPGTPPAAETGKPSLPDKGPDRTGEPPQSPDAGHPPADEKQPPAETQQPKPEAEKPDAAGADSQKGAETQKTDQAGAAGHTGGTGAPPPGTPLTIPQKAIQDGDTKFLDGAWRSITGLQDKSGNPIDLSYAFQKGQGPVTLRRSVGGQQQTCSGTVNSTMEGGRLVLDQSQVSCPDGTVFEKSKVACAPGADGRAKCQGINEHGSTYDVDIVK